MSDALLLGFETAVITGLVLGLLLLVTGLVAGLALGRWCFRRAASENTSLQESLRLMGELSRWTSHVSTDVSEYRGLMESFTEQMAEQAAAGPSAAKIDPATVLAQMLEANRHLQRRLDTAEATLRQQAQEIAAYMSEARTDALTKLNNRRVFDEVLASSLAAWNTQGKTVAVLLIDIDHFKRLNDTRGHLAGDAMLKDLAKLLRDNKPAGSVSARYGGEEFALIMHNCQLTDACVAAQTLRQAVHQHVTTYERQTLQATISVGVAMAMYRENAESLVKRCDDALYAAKSSGRNCVYWHDGVNAIPYDSQPSGEASPAEEQLAADFQDVCRDLRTKLQQVTVLEGSSSVAPRPLTTAKR